IFFFSSRRRHTRFKCDWSSDVCSSDLVTGFVSRKVTVRLTKPVTVVRVPLRVPAAGRWRVKVLVDAPSFLTLADEPKPLFLIARSEERRVGKEGSSGGMWEGGQRCYDE